jgi:predicted amidohydrolase
MCNRVGPEGNVTFAGQSLAAAPDGELLLRAGDREELLLVELPLQEVGQQRLRRPWLQL